MPQVMSPSIPNSLQRFYEIFGADLNTLTQEEKYQLCTAIALMLWGCCISGFNDDDEDEDLDFSDLMANESEPDLINAVDEQLVPAITGNVRAALILLQNEEPETLAELLTVAAECARDDDR